MNHSGVVRVAEKKEKEKESASQRDELRMRLKENEKSKKNRKWKTEQVEMVCILRRNKQALTYIQVCRYKYLG